jgi:murein DD-endopeptidase
LHYEFRINNRPVNAMRVDLPMNESMGGKSKRQYLAKVREYKRLMARG